MPRAKPVMDNPEEHSASDSDLPSIGGTTFTLPTINGPEAQPMMAPIRRKHPPTAAIVLEAIKSLDDKKGSTYVAIKNWMMANYPEINRNRLKLMITKALDKSVKENKLRRNPGETDHPLTIGRYKIIEGKPAVKKDKPKKPVSDIPTTTSEKKVTKKVAPVKKPTKSVKKATATLESASDTEAKAKSAGVSVARRRRSVSESAATASKSVRKPPKKTSASAKSVSASAKSVEPKKKVEPSKSADSNKPVESKNTKTASLKLTATSSSNAASKKSTVGKKRATVKET